MIQAAEHCLSQQAQLDQANYAMLVAFAISLLGGLISYVVFSYWENKTMGKFR